MTIRIDTSEREASSEIFSPSGDFSVQAQIPLGSTGFVEIKGQVDSEAPWVTLGGMSAATQPPILRFAKCPNVRIDLYGNNGVAIMVWSGE